MLADVHRAFHEKSNLLKVKDAGGAEALASAYVALGRVITLARTFHTPCWQRYLRPDGGQSFARFLQNFAQLTGSIP
jgi:hypothetical protein